MLVQVEEQRTRADLLNQAWSSGNLEYLLRPYQRTMLRAARSSSSRSFFALCSRRIGKTRTLAIVASLQDAIVRPGFDCKIAFSTYGQAETVIAPMMDEVLIECPAHLRPQFSAKHLCYEFSNGSVIWLSGADNRRAANRLRGTKTDRALLDEACFMEEFEYLVDSVIMPQLLTTDGTLWYASTPPETTAHPSVAKYLTCKERGDAITFDIWIAEEWWGRERIEEFLEEAGGADSTKAQREYFARLVPEESVLVVPEFIKHKAKLVCEMQRPKYFKRYTVGDFGFNDMTAVSFAYYDFEKARIVIEDEYFAQGQGGIAVTEAVRAKEIDLWGKDAPIDRYADATLQMIADIYDRTKVMWAPVRKDDFDSSLNVLRMDCYRGVLAINPKCIDTIAHLEQAMWNNKRTGYMRIPGFGHFDGVDGVRYLCRHVDRQSNPAEGKDLPTRENTHIMWQTNHKKRTFGRGAFRQMR